METNKTLYQKLKLPPNRANLAVTGPLQNSDEVHQGLFSMGLTASDLEPIDWRKSKISETRNQQQCGDCWAMSSTSALEDRFMIQKGYDSLRLQPAVVAQCTPNPNGQTDQGCGGGLPLSAGQYFEQNGLPEISGNCPSWDTLCTPSNCTLPSCQQIDQACSGLIYKAISGSSKNLPVANGNNVDKATTIINMKKELINGPFVGTFFVPNDFMASSAGYNWDLTNGIFINGAYNDWLDKNAPSNVKQALGNPSGKQWQNIIMEGNSPAGHAVEVVGWDTGNAGSYGEVNYWIVRNSWGTDWGDNGYFKIAMNDTDANNNQYLGFDIPVSSLVIASTNTSTPLGGLFGGGTSFEPDLNSGKSGNGPQSVPSKSNSHKRILMIVVGSVLAVVILGFLLYILKKKRMI